MSELPNTLTPNEYILTPETESLITEPPPIWGRLYSTLKNLPAHDLDKPTFKLGRSDDCDCILTDDTFPRTKLSNISKQHFQILREPDSPVYITDLSKNGTFLNGKKIGKQKKFILQNDDEISIGFQTLKVFIFKSIHSASDDFLPRQLHAKYEVSKLLGKGACGEVRLIFDKYTCQPFAVKKILKARTSREHAMNHVKAITKEIKILEYLSHPLIVSIVDVEENHDAFFIIMEYMQGGQLYDEIHNRRLSEKQIKYIFYQLVVALQYLHVNGIIHRDLKAENILLKDGSIEPIVKISDFGLSKILQEASMANTICGTPYYAAPEILDRSIISYDRKVDIWSLGILLYFMCSKYLPFEATEHNILLKLIVEGKFTMNQPIWENVSDPAKDLIRKMLTKSPCDRINLEEIPDHPWIKDDHQIKNKVHDLVYHLSSTFALNESPVLQESKRRRYCEDSDVVTFN